MLPSLRLAIYCAIGALFWIAAATLPGFFVVALLYNLVVVFIAILDFVLSPAPREWEIAREAPDKMNLGAPNAVALRARWRSERQINSQAARAISITVRDEPPLAWPVEDADRQLSHVARVHLEIPPQTEGREEYSVTPTLRGDFEFGNLSARYLTFLGLWHRQFKRDLKQHVRVYPDISEVRRYELRLRQGRLRDIGLHLMRLRGQGTEFESLREYTTGDEYKAINWKASARRGN